MKKILALLLLVALIALPACGGKSAETAADKQSARDALTELDKYFFDVFERFIPQFNDPASIRITKVIYLDTEAYGDWFMVTVNARNGFGGIVPTDYFVSIDFFGTTESLTKLPSAKMWAIMNRLGEKTFVQEPFDIEAINATVKEYLEANGLN